MTINQEQQSHDGLDCWLCLLYSAATSHERESLVRPFPGCFLSESGEKRFDDLISCIETLPSYLHPADKWPLVNWLTNRQTPTLTPCHDNIFDNFVELSCSASYGALEPIVLRLGYSPEREAKFRSQLGDRQLLRAFHGSKTANFWSVVHNGLVGNLKAFDRQQGRGSLFGEGIYFSTELSVALSFASSALTWPRSRFGRTVSCVCVCEIIDDVRHVVRQVDGGSANASSRRLCAPDSQAGEVPEKYVVVTNSDLILVRYLLLFPTGRSAAACAPRDLALHRWLLRHRLFVAALLVLAVLFLPSMLFRFPNSL